MPEETPQLPVSEQEVQIEAPSLLDKIKAQKKKIFIGIGLFLGVLILAGAVFGVYKLGQRQVPSAPQPTPTPIIEPTPTIDPTVDWQTYTNTGYGYSIKYPSNWTIDDTIFLDEDDQKIAEFSPGKVTPNEEVSCEEIFKRIIHGGPEIKAKEITLSFEGIGRNKEVIRESLKIKDKTWSLMVAETSYESYTIEGKAGGIWYPHHYCLHEEDKLFLINFYEMVLPSKNRELFNLILSTFKFLEEENCVKTDTGESMTLTEAKEIALKSECVKEGNLKETYLCNEFTGTWWLDLEIDRPGCAPACVVNVVTKEAEINWRCTGLLPE